MKHSFIMMNRERDFSFQNERTQRGDYRKPGWELMPAYLKQTGA